MAHSWRICFLVTIMVFAADPMQPSLVARTTGDGLSPLLQHHGPADPSADHLPRLCRLGCTLCSGRSRPAERPARQHLDEQSRPWVIFAWATLGGGILWGADVGL